MPDEQCVGMEPDDASIAIAKRMNPREAMVGGGDDYQAVGFRNLLVAVERMKTVHDLWQRIKMRRRVPPYVHHEIAQVPGFDPVMLSPPGRGPVQRFREPVVKFLVEPVEEIRAIDIH